MSPAQFRQGQNEEIQLSEGESSQQKQGQETGHDVKKGEKS